MAVICACMVLAGPSASFAFNESTATYIAGDDCAGCHLGPWPFETRQGPHGGYSAATNKCAVCHTLHDASTSYNMLPGATITDTCFTCHDGTSSNGLGVYGAIVARGYTVGATHSIDTTNVIPGGNALDGGSSLSSFGGLNGTLSCGDCHSPHDSKTVEPFRGERVRFHGTEQVYGAPDKEWTTSHLLRKQPEGAAEPTDVYGSDWCAGCHAGRTSGAMVNNHPVDSSITAIVPDDFYYYNNVPIVVADDSLETTLGTMGLLGTTTPDLIWHNRGFVMPYPRTPLQVGHNPICQQCHEDARDVGEPGAVNPAGVERWGDGREYEDISKSTTDVPLFQTFPHEGQNESFLVETYDNLCLNCHPVTVLP